MAMAIPPPLVDAERVRDLANRLDQLVPELAALPSNPDVKKVIVAVHGIGDQFRGATIQTVAHAFCRYMGRPAAIPLGQFHHPNATVTSAFIPAKEKISSGFSGEIGFFEVYWANIPREPVQEAHTLEEPRKWANLIAGRLQMQTIQTRREHAEGRMARARNRLEDAGRRLAGQQADSKVVRLQKEAWDLQLAAEAAQAEAMKSDARAATSQAARDKDEALHLLAGARKAVEGADARAAARPSRAARVEAYLLQAEADAARGEVEKAQQGVEKAHREAGVTGANAEDAVDWESRATNDMDEAIRAEARAREAEAKARTQEAKARAAEIKVHRATANAAQDDPQIQAELDARSARKARAWALREGRVAAPPTDEHEYDLLIQVIEELITGVNVADRLASLMAKMGFTHGFDLKKLLDDYLNDVQLVTEFDFYRRRMLGIFQGVMKAVTAAYPGADIHIVAHSEGTVVSFLGLLEGLSGKEGWVGNIKGYMTIGSPLNKHVILWPDIFEDGINPPSPPPPRTERIHWRNYYDFGDPVGFDLAPTRQWMESKGWAPFFEFNGPEDDPEPNHDHGFTRYFFPGAAHNDYWRDGHVFGHFIEDVVNKRLPKIRPAPHVGPYDVPKTNPAAVFTSYLLPYLIASGLLFLAVYLLYRAVRACVDPWGAGLESSREIIANVAGISCLIAGMTVMARLPRLARAHIRSWRFWRIRLIGVTLFTLSAFGFHHLVDDELRRRLFESFHSFGSGLGLTPDLIGLGVIAGVVLLTIAATRRADRSLRILPLVIAGLLGAVATLVLKYIIWDAGTSAVMIFLAALVGVLAWILSRSYPGLGLKPLIHTGGLVILLIVVSRISAQRGPFSAQRSPSAIAEDIEKIAKYERRETLKALDQWRVPADDDISTSKRTMPKDRIRTAAEAASEATWAEETLRGGPIWPVVLAGPAFLYLWWLAALTFDLTFVWHSYVRHQAAQEYLKGVG